MFQTVLTDTHRVQHHVVLFGKRMPGEEKETSKIKQVHLRIRTWTHQIVGEYCPSVQIASSKNILHKDAWCNDFKFSFSVQCAKANEMSRYYVLYSKQFQ